MHTIFILLAFFMLNKNDDGAYNVTLRLDNISNAPEVPNAMNKSQFFISE